MPVYIDSNPAISSSEEFDDCPDEVMRSVAIGYHEAATDASAVSSFEPSRVDFEPAAAIRQHKVTDLQQAPLLPPYLKLSRTTFRSSKDLEELREDLVTTFGKCGVAAKQGSIDGGKASHCTWDCTMERMLARVRLEVRIFATIDGRHLVEIRHLRGCRHAFAEGAADLAAELQVQFEGSTSPARGLFRSPPLISDSALLEMERDSSPGEGDKASTDDEDERRTALHLLALMSPESDWTSQVAGCRAVGALALEVAGRSASHRNHAHLFVSGGAWLDLAARVRSLAYPEARARSSSCMSEELHGELQSVAMAAVANVAGLEHVCNKWLAEAVLAARRALDEPMNDDIHVKREASRAAYVLASRPTAGFWRH